MTTLVGTEFLKLRTTRAWIGYVLALLILSSIGAAGQVGTAPDFELGDREFQRDLLSSSVAAGLIALLLGITSVTVEFRHGTITRTLLVTPRRELVLTAKQIAGFLFGVALALLAVVAVLAVTVPVLASEDAALVLDGGLVVLIARIVLAAALWGALGAGLGALVQSQTVALTAAILWVVVFEPLLAALLDLAELEDAADVLPGRALGALDGRVDIGLAPAAGGAVGLAYVALLGGLGYVRIKRRDIT